MVEYGLPKPGVRVRLPLPAPAQEQRQLCSTFLYKKCRCKPCSLAISQKVTLCYQLFARFTAFTLVCAKVILLLFFFNLKMEEKYLHYTLLLRFR